MRAVSRCPVLSDSVFYRRSTTAFFSCGSRKVRFSRADTNPPARNYARRVDRDRLNDQSLALPYIRRSTFRPASPSSLLRHFYKMLSFLDSQDWIVS